MVPPSLSVVIPVFNEEARIIATLQRIVTFLSSKHYSWEVVVCDDGSTDSTITLIKGFITNETHIQVLELAHAGKGWAIKNGVLFSAGIHRFICDADLSMAIDQLDRFFVPDSKCTEIVIGSRELQLSRRIGEPFTRRLMGRIYNILVRGLAIRDITDTQCGFKCFTGEQVFELFKKQRINGFAFDVEILFLAQRAGIRVREINIDWYYMPSSKVRPILDSLLMTWDLFKIRWIHKFDSNF